MRTETGLADVAPPLKWAGGKRWLPKHEAFRVPNEFKSYIEPFLGSGAIFFHLKPRQSFLSDINSELINVYSSIRDRPDLVRKHLSHHAKRHSKSYYYEVRDLRPRSAFAAAARTLYLNRTCWNGLYRVNRSGEFNVPIGTKTSVELASDDFNELSSVLRECSLSCEDFGTAIARARKGDFLFVDPPYTVAHKNNGFIKYNENLFSWNDQVRLAGVLRAADRRGARFMLTNASHKAIRELYRGFEVRAASRQGVISGSAHGRGEFEELLISNY